MSDLVEYLKNLRCQYRLQVFNIPDCDIIIILPTWRKQELERDISNICFFHPSANPIEDKIKLGDSIIEFKNNIGYIELQSNLNKII